jgi:hypothetical protein
MNKVNSISVSLFLIALLNSSFAIAHHSHATIDNDDVRVLTGVVVKYGWAMPHIFLKVTAPNLEGDLVEYSIEMGNPPSLARQGWSKESLKTGDVITWQGAHDKNKSRNYSTAEWVEKDGVRLGATGQQTIQLEISPSTDFSGVWTRSDPGGFNPHYLPPVAWPYTAFAQAMVDSFDESSNPMLECIDPGPPKSMLLPYPHRIVRKDELTVLIERDMMPEPRVVHLDRDYPMGAPSAKGHSVGWFEGEQFVVETTNFIADSWGIHTGVDSSEQKHLLERFSLIDDGLGLMAEITVTDPIYLAEPHTFNHYWSKLPDRELVQAPCTLESSQLWIEGGYGQ